MLRVFAHIHQHSHPLKALNQPPKVLIRSKTATRRNQHAAHEARHEQQLSHLVVSRLPPIPSNTLVCPEHSGDERPIASWSEKTCEKLYLTRSHPGSALGLASRACITAQAGRASRTPTGPAALPRPQTRLAERPRPGGDREGTERGPRGD